MTAPGPFARFVVATVHNLASLVSLALFVALIAVLGVVLNP